MAVYLIHIAIYTYFLTFYFRWAIDFKTQIQSGEIKSITKAKDLASTLWREHSSTYDNKRPVQLPVDNPGTGHSIKRTRTDDETQYQYRKRHIEEHSQEPVYQEQEDPRIEKALTVKNIMQTIMRMNKEDLKKTLAEKKDTMEELARSQPKEVKTIDNMRLSLLAIEVYERL